MRQQSEDEPDEENESIDFFSLLFGSDEPTDEVNTEEGAKVIETTTLHPFKVLPSTEKSFFDLIRAGLEAIDANADTIGSQINVIVTTPKNNETSEKTSTVMKDKRLETTTEKLGETTQHRTTLVTQSSYKAETISTTIKLPEEILTSSTPKLDTTVKTSSITHNVVSTVKISAQPGMKSIRKLFLFQIICQKF